MTEELKLAAMKRAIRDAMPFGAGDFTVTQIAQAALKIAAPSPELTQLVKAARAMLANLAEGDFISVTRVGDLSEALVPFKEVE